jgi:hypothetical protein
LLSENNQNSTVHKIGGALLALVSLGEHDLAVALLDELWPSELVSASVADVVLTRALASGSEDTQISASSLLKQNADQIRQPGIFFWPIPRPYWRSDLPPTAASGWYRRLLRG